MPSYYSSAGYLARGCRAQTRNEGHGDEPRMRMSMYLFHVLVLLRHINHLIVLEKLIPMLIIINFPLYSVSNLLQIINRRGAEREQA